MLNDLLVPFITVGLLELGDKTQLAILCLAGKTKKHFKLLVGVMCAFFIAQVLGVFVGKLAGTLIPQSLLKYGSAALFIGIGIYTLLSTEEEEKCDMKNPFLSGFGLVLATEMGDKSQYMTAYFATDHNPYLVLCGAMLALLILSVSAVYLGKKLSQKIKPKIMNRIAGSLFIILGILALIL